MANYRIKLSDGTTTVDLLGGSDTTLRDAGLNMPPPRPRRSFVSNPFFQGARLAASSYDNRMISMSVKVQGSSLSDLKTNVRSIERILNDARERTLLGFGDQFYFEFQWGDSANESVFFDILDGDLILPRSYLTAPHAKQFTILDANLNLICKPFGRFTNQTVSQATLDNSQSIFELQESYLVDDNGVVAFNGVSWNAQTFTTNSAFTASACAVKGLRLNTITTLTAELWATVGGLPSGGAIASGTLDVSAFDDDATYVGWAFITFVTPVALDNSTVYAVILHIEEGGGNQWHWRTDTTAGFAGGQRAFSGNSGSTWTADATDDFLFAVFSSETDENFQDITTSATFGDVPAKMYHKIDLNSASGSKKVWVAKRTGTRQSDDLWTEGQDVDSFTDIVGGAHNVNDVLVPEDALSNAMYEQAWIVPAGGAIAANTEVSRMNFTISAANLPRGQFRVLVRIRSNSQDANDFDHMSWGFGWSYGSKTFTPTEAAGEYFEAAADNTWETLDLGVLNLPPIAESDVAGNNDFELRIYNYATDTLTNAESYQWDLDYIFLLPIDEDVVIISSVAAAGVIAVDSITDPPNVFLIDGSDNIDDFPDYVGNPMMLGRESTRLYILRDDVKAVTYTVDITYQPQFLVI